MTESHDVCSDMSCSETPTFMVGVYKPEDHDDRDSTHYHACRYHLVDVVQLLVDDGHLVIVEGQHDS